MNELIVLPDTKQHQPQELTAQIPAALPLHAADLSTNDKVRSSLASLLAYTRGQGESLPEQMAAALTPWLCNKLKSDHSRRAYMYDLKTFRDHMREHCVELHEVTADDVSLYAEALVRAGQRPATISRTLSAIRGAYHQFAKKGLMDWERVSGIEAVESPLVTKNTTPALSQAEAVKLLHAPDTTTLAGLRDHAMLFVFFKTACRSSAIANAKVGHVERTDTDYYLRVTEKGKKEARKALLEASPALLDYMEKAGIRGDLEGALFRPVAKDRKMLLRKHMARQDICAIVKKYARQVGIDVDRIDSRGVCTHSLRKTALNNALENNAPIEKVQQLAGHSQITTTEGYRVKRAKDAEDAARHIQIR